MKDEKVYIEGYVVGFLSGTDGTREKKIQVASGEIVSIDENFIYKSIEPQKVIVPQFVADWYEENKDDFEFNIWDWTAFRNEPEKLKNKEFNYWINDAEGNPIQTLVNMHQFGYEVEKEKRYLVRFKGLNRRYIILKYDKYDKTWFLGGELEFDFYKKYHTRQELEEDGFGWVFNCPGIELEEIEE